MVNNEGIAEIFDQVAILLRIKEDNEFHARAYEEAARIIRGSKDSFESYIQNEVDFTDKYRGIGKGISDHISEIVHTGKLKKLEKLKEEIPISLINVTKIRGVGPKTARLVWEEEGIKTIDELESAARSGQLREIKGLGKKTEQNILNTIEDVKKWSNRHVLKDTNVIVNFLTSYLEKSSDISQFEFAGSWRRHKETVGDLDVLAISEEPSKAMNYFLKWKKIVSVESEGKTKSTVFLKNNFRVDFRLLPPKSFGSALLYFTGSKAHNIHLRSLAKEKSYTLSEYGVFRYHEGLDRRKLRPDNENWVTGESEEKIYNLLGLSWIPPELREDRGEIKAAKNHNLPHLISLDDIRGDLQTHSKWSDGINTLEEIAKKAVKIGYEYLAFTDHSKSMAMTGGLDAQKLNNQIREIKKIEDKFPQIHLLKGMEVDILKNGKLDISNEVLEQLDIVLVSIHSHFELDKETQTERVLTAFQNDHVNIFSHPTSRIINHRKAIELDLEAIFDMAKEEKIAIECNAHPNRLDLNAINLLHLKEKQGLVTINSDAHSLEELLFMKYGIYQARRGWIEPEMVINTWNYEKLMKFLKK